MTATVLDSITSYRNALNIACRCALKTLQRPEWERARTAIRSIPPEFTNRHICRNSTYALGFVDFALTPAYLLLGQFLIGVVPKPHAPVERVYYATVPTSGPLAAGEMFSERRIIEMLTDSIELVIALVLEGEKTRIEALR